MPTVNRYLPATATPSASEYGNPTPGNFQVIYSLNKAYLDIFTTLT